MKSFFIVFTFAIASCVAQNWTKIPGAAVDISAKGNELWVINKNQNIYRWTGTNWQLKPGAAVRVGASPDGWTWVVNSADNIYRWNTINNNWDLMPGALVQINAISKDRALGVNRAGGIYLWENNAWTKLPGAATWAGIGDGDERWVINSAQKIYRWNHSRSDWDLMPGAAVNVDVQNPCRVIVTNASNRMYIWKNNNWTLLTGSGTRSTINENSYYTVNSAQEIWKDMDGHMFLKLGSRYTKTKLSTTKLALQRFKSFFGVTPNVCRILWNKIGMTAPRNAQPKHLLWCLSFLKEYSMESYRRAIFKADEKTMRKWTWRFVKLLANMDVIFWDRRFDEAVDGQTCFCSLDGVDFPIEEPTPFSPKWFSHKFRGPGVRYEIGLNIRTGRMVWTHGGYPCEEYPDLKLAREAYTSSVNPGELTVADKGYNDAIYFIQKTVRNARDHGTIMARHETVNKRMKQFNILKNRYRHGLEKHPSVFHAVANVTQLMIENGHPLFSIFK